MARASKQGLVKVLGLDALLDKLVAVRLDLEPICGTSEVRGQIVDSRAAIAEAVEVLRTAQVGVTSNHQFAPDYAVKFRGHVSRLSSDKLYSSSSLVHLGRGPFAALRSNSSRPPQLFKKARTAKRC